MSNNSVYNELKLTLLEAAKATQRPVQEMIDAGSVNPDVLELNNLFQVMLEDRKEVFEKFRVLFEERKHLFQSLLNLTTASFYIKSIESHISTVYKVFQFLEVVGSSIFENNLLNFISVIRSGNIQEDFFMRSKSYFNDNLTFISNLYKFTERGFAFSGVPGSYVIEKDAVAIDEHSTPELLTFYMLNVLSSVTALNISTLQSEIETFPSFIRNIRERVFLSDSELNTSLRKIIDNLDSYLFVQNKRSQDDNQYFVDYTQEVDDSISKIVKFIEENLSSLNFETIEFLKEANRMIELNLLYSNLKETFSTTVQHTLEAIKTTNFVIESYYPYFAINENFSREFVSSINSLEEMNFDEEAQLAEQEGTEFNINFLFQFIRKFSDFYNKVREGERPLIQDDVYNIFTLYSGVTINAHNFSIGNELIGYSLSSLLRKNLILRSEVKDTIMDINNIALELAINNSIIVSEIVDNERVSSSLKTISREFEKLDLLLFRDILSSPSNDTFREDFDKRIYYFMLTELLKNKNDLNKNIQLLITVFNKSKNNFKMIYLDRIIRQILSKIKLVYLGLGDVNSIIEDETIVMIRNYLSEDSSKDDNDLLDKYETVWNFYYNNPDTIIERTLKDNSPLKEYLEGEDFIYD